MYVIRITFLLFTLNLIIQGLHAQDLQAYSRSDLMHLAKKAEYHQDYLSAADFYSELHLRKRKKSKYLFLLARAYHKSNQFKEAEKSYEELIESDPDKYPLVPFYLGRIKIMLGNCKEALPLLDQFRKDYRGEKNDRLYRRMAKFSIEGCEVKLPNDSDEFIVEPLSAAINGSNMEGSPVFLSEDEFVFSSMRMSPGKEYSIEESISQPNYYKAKKARGGWVSTETWEFIPELGDYVAVSGTYNASGDRFYFSACRQLLSKEMQCDLFRMQRIGDDWGKAEKLPEPLNSTYQERHPAVGIDDRGRETLYFVSDREDGKGGFDLWYSTYYEKKDEYREPRNLGSRINSVGDELSPFIDPENGRLYFSSNGHPGYGGLDIFTSVGSRSRWKEPENIGGKINGSMDELYYRLDPSGKSGLFVSNRLYGQKSMPCCDDLFYFTDPDLVQLSYSGSVKNEEGEVVSGTDIVIYELDDSGEERYLRKSFQTDGDGQFDFRLEPQKKYEINVGGERYFREKQEISTMDKISSKKHHLDFNLREMSDRAFVLENIYYGYDESHLSEKAISTIDTTIYEILVANPEIIVEIGSHTDDKGSAAYNLRLSQNRAESVVNYLIRKGISKKRLKAKGYGESRPVAPNQLEDGSDNPEGRAKNRRTEFKVIGKIELKEDD